MYKKILVPLDNSALAEKILPQVEDLAACMNSEIVLLTVGNLGPLAILSEVDGHVLNQLRSNSKKTAEQYLGRVAEGLAAKGLKTMVAYREGDPTVKIVETANDYSCDLIAMATHGRGEIAWVLGSVAEKVVSHANTPVLLLRVLDTPLPEAKVKPDIKDVESRLWGVE